MNESVMAVRVRVPATSANLGPAFDSLALALTLYNEFEIRQSSHGIQVENHGEGAEILPTDGSNLVVRAMYAVYKQVGKEPVGLHIKAEQSYSTGQWAGQQCHCHRWRISRGKCAGW